MNISTNNSTIKYIPGNKNIVADFLSREITHSDLGDDKHKNEHLNASDHKSQSINVIINAQLDVRQIAESSKQPEPLAHPEIAELSRLNLSHEQDIDQDIQQLS